MTQSEWAAQLTRVIAEQIRRYRNERGMSAQRLASRCRDFGLEISRSTLADLENGRRPIVSVAELLVLAAALEVPPRLLMLPLGRPEELEIVPGLKVSIWDAESWWDGLNVIKGSPKAGLTLEGNLNPEPIVLFKNLHDHLVYGMIMVGKNAEAMKTAYGKLLGDQEAADLLVKQVERDAREMFRQLADLRKAMRDDGFIPPPLPDALAAVDQLQSGRDDGEAAK